MKTLLLRIYFTLATLNAKLPLPLQTFVRKLRMLVIPVSPVAGSRERLLAASEGGTENVGRTDNELITEIRNLAQQDYCVMHFTVPGSNPDSDLPGNLRLRITPGRFESQTPDFRIVGNPATDLYLVELGLPGPALQSGSTADAIAAALTCLLRVSGIQAAVAWVDDPSWHAAARQLPGVITVYDARAPGSRVAVDADILLTRGTDDEGTRPDVSAEVLANPDVETIDAAIRASFPPVSVVMLTFNQIDFTKACIESLLHRTRYPDWELIIVDNASTDGTTAYLHEVEGAHANIRVVLNPENLGFAAGNNVGAAAARGDYLVILNNDTCVTKGWLTDLLRHLRCDASVGIIGPVTNNIGNEAKIDVIYDSLEDMQAAALEYTRRHRGSRFFTRTVAFFCAALSRELYDLVGGLDEAFGTGFFEDDDYCNRVRQAGYEVAIAEDVFIHHHLSASFDAIDQGERQALFARNRKYYESKWGPWVPHAQRRRS